MTTRLILLDASPLGLVTNPKGRDEARRCRAWLHDLLGRGVPVMVPEGADYEVRRDLFRAGRRGGLDHRHGLRLVARMIRNCFDPGDCPGCTGGLSAGAARALVRTRGQFTFANDPRGRMLERNQLRDGRELSGESPRTTI